MKYILKQSLTKLIIVIFILISLYCVSAGTGNIDQCSTGDKKCYNYDYYYYCIAYPDDPGIVWYWSSTQYCGYQNYCYNGECRPACPNGIVDNINKYITPESRNYGETCDDGNTINTDSCISCQNAICGDGYIWTNHEACDDGNMVSNDGCSASCQIEYYYACVNQPSVCTLLSVCGNSKIEPGEQCDDGNKISGDCCSSACQYENFGMISCGVGECNNIIDKCTNGIQNICTAKQPSVEICDGKDNDCDNSIDENVTLTFYKDTDGDGFGTPILFTQGCSLPTGYVTNNTDCNDANNLIKPGIKEICGDGLDNNCDGKQNEGCDCTPNSDIKCFNLTGVCASYTEKCTPDGKSPICSYSSVPNYQPTESICDTLDNDCDGVIDEDCDKDKDGFIDPAVSCVNNFKAGDYKVYPCTNEKDCDDTNMNRFPGNTETCDGIDNNCDGITDNLADYPFCYQISTTNMQPVGVCKDMKAMCDSANRALACPNTNYEADEKVCDLLDNDCDGLVDEGCTCKPGDIKECGSDAGTCKKGTQACIKFDWTDCTGFVGPSDELCDNKDNDCNGYIDENLTRSCEQCDNLQECTEGVWQPCNCLTEQQVDDAVAKNDLSTLIIESNLTKEDIYDALKTIEYMNHTISSRYENGNTIIDNVAVVDTSMKNVDYVLYIPKCLSEYLDKIQFENPDYKVLREDPIIAWHFDEVTDRIDLSYKVKGEIDAVCMQQIKGLPIARTIGNLIRDIEPSIESPTNNSKTFAKEQKNKNIILPLIIIISMVVFIVYYQTKPKVTIVQEDPIERERMIELSLIRDMNFQTREQAYAYMQQKGFSEDTIQWILKNI
ncbi:MAG: MopE-related protein [archaeon]